VPYRGWYGLRSQNSQKIPDWALLYLGHFQRSCSAVSKTLVAEESTYWGFRSINVIIMPAISAMLVPSGMHLSNQKDACATVRVKNSTDPFFDHNLRAIRERCNLNSNFGRCRDLERSQSYRPL